MGNEVEGKVSGTFRYPGNEEMMKFFPWEIRLSLCHLLFVYPKWVLEKLGLNEGGSPKQVDVDGLRITRLRIASIAGEPSETTESCQIPLLK